MTSTTPVTDTPETDGTTGLAERLDHIATTGAFLARVLLSPPDAALIDQLHEPGLLDAWPLPADDATAHALRLVRRGLDASVGELTRDHAHLFVGPGPVLAPPWESAHRPDLADGPVARARTATSPFGLPGPQGREPDDHAGHELELVVALASEALALIEDGDCEAVDDVLASARRFVSEHVLVWVPAFAKQVIEGSDTVFYQGVAALVDGWCRYVAEAFVR